MKKYLGWIVLTLVVVGCLGVLYFFSGNKSNQENIKANVPEVVETDHVRGVIENYKVTLIEYSDFQCPACAAYEPVIEQLLKDFPNELRLVYRHFPLSIHENAESAALAAECSKEQNKFWEYHDKLFQNQQSLDIASLKKYATDLKLETKQFNDCLDNKKYQSIVQQDLQDGAAVGVSGTPTFFVNGIPMVGAQPFSSFKQVIDGELNQ